MPDITQAAGGTPYGMAAQAASGILSAGIGLLQRGQANRWLKRNPEQQEAMPLEVKRNQQLAEIGANVGMPQEQYNRAMKNIQRQQLFALRRAQDLGGGKALSILGGINEQGNDAVAGLDARDAQMRIDNQGRLIGVNNNVANWKSQLFDRNVRQAWLRKYQQMMGQLGSGNQNLTGGIDKLAASGIEYLSGRNRSAGGNNLMNEDTEHL